MYTPLTPAEAENIYETYSLVRAEMEAMGGGLASMSRQLTFHEYPEAREEAVKALLAAEKAIPFCQQIVSLIEAKMASTTPAHLVEPGPLGETSKEEL
jgi:hypothetical protein